MNNIQIVSSAAAIILAGTSVQSRAASCATTYADSGLNVLEGNTVCFLYDVTAVSALYGTLTVSGDSIISTPGNFLATSVDGGSAQTVGSGTVRVAAKDGYSLMSINVAERGNYRMTGPGSNVDLDALFEIADTADPLFGSFQSANLDVIGLPGLQDDTIHNWSATAGFDMTTALWDGINSVNMTLTNILTASTAGFGETATIEKTLSGTKLLSIVTSPVPVPAAFWLFGSGLIGLVGFMRRKNSNVA